MERACGQQVRIQRSSSHYAVYTVSEVRQESPDTVVRMGVRGRQRLGTSGEFAGTLTSRVPHPTYSTVQAETNSEFIERLKDNGSHNGLVAIAPHGGDIEPYTDRQAERVAARLAAKAVSAWRCKGWKQPEGAFERWHITSIDIHPASFPLLQRIANRGFQYAVAFHGFGQNEILIGGGTAAGPLKAEIKGAIERAITGSGIAVRIATSVEGYGGDSPRNIVNRLTAGGEIGIQIEQSFSARESYGHAIADAVADVYRAKLS
jgi:phage replication-related protein YjqB (UPF0714/DUF867 family)